MNRLKKPLGLTMNHREPTLIRDMPVSKEMPINVNRSISCDGDYSTKFKTHIRKWFIPYAKNENTTTD